MRDPGRRRKNGSRTVTAATWTRCSNAEDVQVCSPRIVQRFGVAADGWICGKERLREHFAIGLRQPNLRFELIEVLAGVNAMVVAYRRESGAMAADCSEPGPDGRMTRMIACYGALPRR